VTTVGTAQMNNSNTFSAGFDLLVPSPLGGQQYNSRLQKKSF
jgi:hypothetical protein